jgi:hypothetical protein
MKAHWVLTKLGSTGIPIICSSAHPEYKREQYDIRIGQSCFEQNYKNQNIVDISDKVNLSTGHHVFAFREFLETL